MSIKFPISAIALATALTLVHSAIASAEAYKSKPDQVVVTGLKAKQSYDVQAVSLKGKTTKTKSAAANTCGELLVNGASKMKSLTVGTETIDIATLTTKAHAPCTGKKAASMKGKTDAMAPAAGTPATATPATATPATATPASSTPPVKK